jgi:hypothetical protein
MLPREASESFSEGLKESLLQLKDRSTARVWADAESCLTKRLRCSLRRCAPRRFKGKEKKENELLMKIINEHGILNVRVIETGA